MKAVLHILFALVLTSTFSACKKCKNEDPRARIVNGGQEKVSVHIETSGGNTENINNVQSGTSSEYRSYAAGNVSFDISIGNQIDVSYELTMEECWEYDINIDQNNNVTSVPTDRNE